MSISISELMDRILNLADKMSIFSSGIDGLLSRSHRDPDRVCSGLHITAIDRKGLRQPGGYRERIISVVLDIDGVDNSSSYSSVVL